jgi:hypothetical protein
MRVVLFVDYFLAPYIQIGYPFLVFSFNSECTYNISWLYKIKSYKTNSVTKSHFECEVEIVEGNWVGFKLGSYCK